ncbi:hypothetical protein [Ruegeria faecimaris]|uniref:hypothetical protein n=1 Tax=Ruegeria faecimaris TaxID=686389 RepID=UPI00232B7066|nr:hypothetical protein [Ruegeria faecimaris]
MVAAFLAKKGLKELLSVPIFLALSMSFSTVFVATYAELLRAIATRSFNADVEIQNSFYQSLKHALQEGQFFLHGAALKDCVPFAWSYRRVSYFQLPNNVAVNVLPSEWLVSCNIIGD